MVRHEELNNDEYKSKIVSHSNAFVKKIDMLLTENVNNQYQVKVRVDIESQRLIEELKEKYTVNNVVDDSIIN